MSAETWMTAAEAVERRFADGLTDSDEEAAPVFALQKRLLSVDTKLALARLALVASREKNR